MKKLNIDLTGKNCRIPALFIAVAVFLCVIAGITFARYILQDEHSGVAEAEAFYFTSDLLAEEEENKSYFIDPATEEFVIIFFNAEDSKRITKQNITFEVTAVGGTVKEKGNFTLSGGDSAQAKVTIHPDSGADTVTVKAVSSAPYAKTLTATFQLAAENQYKLEDTAGERAAVLSITCAQLPVDGISLIVPDGIVPDATNTFITRESDRSYKYKPTEAGVYSIVLLKKDPSVNISKAESEFTDIINIE